MCGLIFSKTHSRYQTSVHGGLSGLILAWANELNSHDSESKYRNIAPVNIACLCVDIERSFIVACCNTFAYVFQAWLPM